MSCQAGLLPLPAGEATAPTLCFPWAVPRGSWVLGTAASIGVPQLLPTIPAGTWAPFLAFWGALGGREHTVRG